MRTENFEVGSRTRRRPSKAGLCRGKDAEVGKTKGGKVRLDSS